MQYSTNRTSRTGGASPDKKTEEPSIVIVISPLTSLINDQVRHLSHNLGSMVDKEMTALKKNPNHLLLCGYCQNANLKSYPNTPLRREILSVLQQMHCLDCILKTCMAVQINETAWKKEFCSVPLWSSVSPSYQSRWLHSGSAITNDVLLMCSSDDDDLDDVSSCFPLFIVSILFLLFQKFFNYFNNYELSIIS